VLLHPLRNNGVLGTFWQVPAPIAQIKQELIREQVAPPKGSSRRVYNRPFCFTDRTFEKRTNNERRSRHPANATSLATPQFFCNG
jgi:hypothetical protein